MRDPHKDSPAFLTQRPTRRRILRDGLAAASGAIMGARMAGAQTAPATFSSAAPAADALIDRRAVVTRHNVALNAIDLLAPISVGNGDFALTCDITGLQTLADAYRPKIPLNTMASWAWHGSPNPERFVIDHVMKDYDVGGRKVPYADAELGKGIAPAAQYLRANPHRPSLGRVAFAGPDGAPIRPDAITAIDQQLDLWTGTVRSRFTHANVNVEVITAAHPTRHAVAFRVRPADAFARAGIAIQIAFPAASDDWRNPDDWDAPAAHATTCTPGDHAAHFARAQDEWRYAMRATWRGAGPLAQTGAHAFRLDPSGEAFDLVVEFAPGDAVAAPLAADDIFAASAAHWPAFWSGGAAIDFAGCTDARAAELERRVILSQYLTAVHCAGTTPPQVSGLLFNTWHGKVQLETHPLMAAHFAAWDRFPLVERSLGYYSAILAEAQKVARRQGYEGARWPKMTDATGVESPGPIGPFIVWQQPHPIYFAELAYRATPTRETLDRYEEVVDQTARFMASYPTLDAAADGGRGRYTLGPAIVPAQESFYARRVTTLNPTFELAYWAWGLGTAQKWRERLGRPREERWTQILDRLSRPTLRDRRYAAVETEPQLHNGDHPSFLMAFGLLPKTRNIDERTMRQTARWTKAKWKWNAAWGWDFSILAMTFARLNDAESAVDALLIESERNRFLASGHNVQGERIAAYLPGNGALLAAIAMMAGGWEGGPATPAPGFPTNGRWDVRCEGFARSI